MTCTRADGSSTWTVLHPAIELHDFAHYVVETQLGFNEAFFGTIAQGFDISDYALARNERPEALMPVNLSEQAHQTEHIVNLLQVFHVSNDTSINFIDILQGILKKNSITFPKELDQENLNVIISRLNDLFSEWNELDEGGSIELEFEI